MTWIDWVIAGFVLYGALQGMRRGAFAALLGILAVFLGYLAASAWYHPLGELVARYLKLSPPWSATVAFLILLVAVYELIGVLIVMAIGTDDVRLPSRFVGAVLGVVRGAALAAALLVVVLAAPPGDPVRRDVDRSAIAPYAVSAYRGALRTLAGILPQGLRPFGTEDTRF